MDSDPKHQLRFEYYPPFHSNSGVRIAMPTSTGGLRAAHLPGRLKLWAPDEYPESILNRIISRNFDFDTPRDLVFRFVPAGIGDIVIGLTVILALKNEINKRQKNHFKIYGIFDQKRFTSLKRLLDRLHIFDGYCPDNLLDLAPIEVNHELLDCTNASPQPDFLMFGNAWETLWAKWGIPGPFQFPKISFKRPFQMRAHTELKSVLAHLFHSNSVSPYLLFCPEASDYFGTEPSKKAWPEDYWVQITNWALNETSYKIVFLASHPSILKWIPQHPRVGIYNPLSQSQGDLFRLFTLVSACESVVGIDSAPAHIAGFLGVPCLTLFGPTSPVVWGNPRNHNLRVSTCPSCSASLARYLCAQNVCMEELDAELAIGTLKRQLERNRHE